MSKIYVWVDRPMLVLQMTFDAIWPRKAPAACRHRAVKPLPAMNFHLVPFQVLSYPESSIANRAFQRLVMVPDMLPILVLAMQVIVNRDFGHSETLLQLLFSSESFLTLRTRKLAHRVRSLCQVQCCRGRGRIRRVLDVKGLFVKCRRILS